MEGKEYDLLKNIEFKEHDLVKKPSYDVFARMEYYQKKFPQRDECTLEAIEEKFKNKKCLIKDCPCHAEKVKKEKKVKKEQ